MAEQHCSLVEYELSRISEDQTHDAVSFLAHCLLHRPRRAKRRLVGSSKGTEKAGWITRPRFRPVGCLGSIAKSRRYTMQKMTSRLGGAPETSNIRHEWTYRNGYSLLCFLLVS
jgi:hypothetical protein